MKVRSPWWPIEIYRMYGDSGAKVRDNTFFDGPYSGGGGGSAGVSF